MKILIVVEDPTMDQYIVKPIVERMVSQLGLRARVEVLQDPHLRGIDQALDAKVLKNIVADNPMVDRFLLVVDRDCNRANNKNRVADRERQIGTKLLGCLAREEIEVWMLALQDKLPAAWSTVRKECDPKERYAEPFLVQSGWATDVGHGRKRAMAKLPRRYKRLLSRCGELALLEGRLRRDAPGSGAAMG